MSHPSRNGDSLVIQGDGVGVLFVGAEAFQTPSFTYTRVRRVTMRLHKGQILHAAYLVVLRKLMVKGSLLRTTIQSETSPLVRIVKMNCPLVRGVHFFHISKRMSFTTVWLANGKRGCTRDGTAGQTNYTKGTKQSRPPRGVQRATPWCANHRCQLT